MRSKLFIATLAALVACAGTASAQNATGTSGTSMATNSVTVNASTGAGNGSAGNGSGNGQPNDSNVHYSGHEWSTPSVQGSYFAGANPCLIGVGGSAAGGPIGLSFTFGRSDSGCQRRSDAAAWHALGHDDVAIARMCQDDDNHAAFEAVGFTCPQARPKAAATAAPVASPIAALVAPVVALPPSPQPVARLTMASAQPSWCDTVTGAAERARYKQACAF